jgi:hypothetical protein
MDRVEFEEEAVREYLDRLITHWREIRNSSTDNTVEQVKAICYTDAYQNVRVSLFGDVPQDKDIGDPHAQSAAEWSGGDDGTTMPPEHGTIGDPNRR